jgi:tryptophan synthase alpha chain
LAITSSDAISDRFALLKEGGRTALLPYVTAGYPDLTESLELLQGLEAAGADIVEVGVPFSDPLADGPIIQASSQVALSQGITFDAVLELVYRAQLGIPVVLFSYLNPILAAGRGALVRAAEAGVHGILLTDLPVGSDPELENWLGSGPLAFIRLVAPTTPDARMREIGAHGTGFVYLISRLGVTGIRDDIPEDLPRTITRLRCATTLPICVGFGISKSEQARRVAGLADGVVVGSAVVRAAGESVASALALVSEMRRALDDSRSS